MFDHAAISAAILALTVLGLFAIWKIRALARDSSALIELTLGKSKVARITPAEQANLNRMQNLASLARDPSLATKFRQFAKGYRAAAKPRPLQPMPKSLPVVLNLMTEAMQAGKSAGQSPSSQLLEDLHSTADEALSFLKSLQASIEARQDAILDVMVSTVSRMPVKS